MRLKFLLTAALALTLSTSMAMAQDMKGNRMGRGDGGHFFSQMDTDKDGKVSQQEFLAFHQKRFEAMDANKDGYLTKEEAAAYWKQRRAEHPRGAPPRPGRRNRAAWSAWSPRCGRNPRATPASARPCP